MIEKSFAASSSYLKVIEYHKYFDTILAYGKPNFNEVFLREFIDDYISSITHYEVWGAEPKKSEEILSQLKNLADLNIASDNISIIKTEIERIETQLKKLGLILNGETYSNATANKAVFPLIYSSAPEGFYGILESVTIHITRSSSGDKFIIVPSEKEIEKKILEQCRHSWLAALVLSREYIKKPYTHHEIIISFNKKDGFYEGNSLGTALTISFLEELLKFYNPTYIIKIKEQTAFTGGMSESGKVLACGEEIIKQKVKAVFFSKMNAFVLPKCEEAAAQTQLTELKKNYPNRKLKLVPVEDINDVLNRRDVIDIRKQKLVVRTGKLVKKNWVSAVVTVILAVLFAFLFVMDWDDNPAILKIDGGVLFVKNKNGKILWTKKVGFTTDKDISLNEFHQYQKIVDVNDDRINEVLLCKEIFSDTEFGKEEGRLACFDFKGQLVWKYIFEDSVSSFQGKLPPIYNIKMIDTITTENIKQIICIACNGPSYSSAIFKLDVKNGGRLIGTLWNDGHIVDGIIEDVNNDSKDELIINFFNNSYHKTGIGIVEINKISGMAPCRDDRKLFGKKAVEFLSYILVPNTDYNKFFKLPMNIPGIGYLRKSEKEKVIMWATMEGEDSTSAGIGYEFSYNLNDINIVIVSKFAVKRNALVLKGLLSYPLTDTKEYSELLKNQILYWNGKNFVNKDVLD